MTDEVGRLVLNDNYEQNLALANSIAQSPSTAPRARGLDAHPRAHRSAQPRPRGAAEPSRGGRPARSAARASPRPSSRCCWPTRRSGLPTSCWRPTWPTTRSCAATCTPTSRTRCARTTGGAMEDHPLRREIVVTQIVNDLVNGAGITYLHRLAGETGASVVELTRANFIAREIFGTAKPAPRDQPRGTTRSTPRCRPGCGSRCARWSSGPRGGWSATAVRRSTARPPSTTSRWSRSASCRRCPSC